MSELLVEGAELAVTTMGPWVNTFHTCKLQANEYSLRVMQDKSALIGSMVF
jgi:hypothetical protein